MIIYVKRIVVIMVLVILTGTVMCACDNKNDQETKEEKKENVSEDKAQDADNTSINDSSNLDLDLLKEYVIQIYDSDSIKQGLIETESILKNKEYKQTKYELVEEAGIKIKVKTEENTFNKAEDLPDDNIDSLFSYEPNKNIIGVEFNEIDYFDSDNRKVLRFVNSINESDKFPELITDYNEIVKIISDEYGKPDKTNENADGLADYYSLWESTLLGKISVSYKVYPESKDTLIANLQLNFGEEGRIEH